MSSVYALLLLYWTRTGNECACCRANISWILTLCTESIKLCSPSPVIHGDFRASDFHPLDNALGRDRQTSFFSLIQKLLNYCCKFMFLEAHVFILQKILGSELKKAAYIYGTPIFIEILFRNKCNMFTSTILTKDPKMKTLTYFYLHFLHTFFKGGNISGRHLL